MDDVDFSIFDVEHCILHGVIVERQKDQKSTEWKYLVREWQAIPVDYHR
jgi:hypothetical protein